MGRVLNSSDQKDIVRAEQACKAFHKAWKSYLSSPGSGQSVVLWATSQKGFNIGVMNWLVRMGAAPNPAVLAALPRSNVFLLVR